MYISAIQIKNYRSFINQQILFNSGLNVLIGHNNAGKTNVLKALQLVFDRRRSSQPSMNDFNLSYSDFSSPPTIEIMVTISEKDDEEDDKPVIYDWLIQEQYPYEAQLTYVFSLPVKHWNEFTEDMKKHKDEEGNFNKNTCFKRIEKKYLPKYTAVVYGGNPLRQEKADEGMLSKFDFQFLDAIRDAENQMFYGDSTLLRDVLNYFMDYDLTKGQDFERLDADQRSQLIIREQEFKEKAGALLKHLIKRVSTEQILEYSRQTGASKGGNPDFDAEMTELELLFALRLIVEKQGFNLPIKNNGLGYNNLLFIALILAKMQMERSGFQGDNAKVFPILAIEEPEAHLHPAMQYKFLKFLNQNLHHQKQARQAFITTHSTQITAAVDLDAIICLYEDCYQIQRVGYPAKVFDNIEQGKASKSYVKRFLDATKSNMLFAEKIVFVEGLAEQLLLPCLAAYVDKEQALIDQHVAIVSVESRTFKHFLQLFAFHQDRNPYGIHKKVVCITDADPSRRQRPVNDKDIQRWKSCYPCELDVDHAVYEYQPLGTHAQELNTFASEMHNIKICTPIEGQGKTLEYELAIYNPANLLLLTDNLPPKAKSNLVSLIEKYVAEHSLEELIEISKHTDVNDIIRKSIWPEARKKEAFIATLYHRILESKKGEHAFHLERQLRENLALEKDKADFVVPPYLLDAILFITE